jgi:hypothetical protein
LEVLQIPVAIVYSIFQAIFYHFVASKELTKPENAKKNEFLPQHFRHPENPGLFFAICNCMLCWGGLDSLVH